MSKAETSIEADCEAAWNAFLEGRPVDPDVAERVRQASEKITREVFEKHGLLDVAVPTIREFRDS